MNESIKDRWVSRLRSGDYPQTTGFLRTDSGFCCLGVLCDMYIEENANKCQWNQHHDEDTYYLFDVNDFLPFEVMSWAGMHTYDGKFLPVEVMTWAGMATPDGASDNDGNSLSKYNDLGWSFDDIADKIEQDWERL